MLCWNCVKDEITFSGFSIHWLWVSSTNESISTFLFGHLLFVWTVGNSNNSVSHSFCQFKTHCTETSNSNDSYAHLLSILHSLVGFPVIKRVKHGDSCAEEWTGLFERNTIRDLVDEPLMDNIRAGISTKGLGFWVSTMMSIFSHSVVGMKRTACFAPNFVPILASLALHAGVNYTTYTYIITYLKSGHSRSDFNYSSTKFMTWNQWIRGSCEMVHTDMTIWMTDTAIFHFKFNIVLTTSWSVDPYRLECFTPFGNTPTNFSVLTFEGLWDLFLSLLIFVLKFLFHGWIRVFGSSCLHIFFNQIFILVNDFNMLD